MTIQNKVMKKLWDNGNIEKGKGNIAVETAIYFTLQEVEKIVDDTIQKQHGDNLFILKILKELKQKLKK